MPDELRTVHPLRGAIWGLVFGTGLALAMVVTTTIPLDAVAMSLVVVAATAVGVLWGLFAPARDVRPTDDAAIPHETRHHPRPGTRSASAGSAPIEEHRDPAGALAAHDLRDRRDRREPGSGDRPGLDRSDVSAAAARASWSR